MTTESLWAPEACTLPTVEKPLRVAEFDDLFATALRDIDRPALTRLRLTLDTAVEASARELVARESECCSFFTFTVSRTATELVIDVGAGRVLERIATRPPGAQRFATRAPRHAAGPDRSPPLPAETVTVLRVTKQRLGFTLDEVADLLDAGRPSTAKATIIPQADRGRGRIGTAIVATLREALDVGCSDLMTCAHSPCCPLPFAELADGRTSAG